MKTVGVRELKNRLSEYLRRARSGEEILVTDRGEVLAELGPPGRVGIDAAVPVGLVGLARRGLATLGAPGGANLYPLCLGVAAAGTAQPNFWMRSAAIGEALRGIQRRSRVAARRSRRRSRGGTPGEG